MYFSTSSWPVWVLVVLVDVLVVLLLRHPRIRRYLLMAESIAVSAALRLP